jgi:AraC-like DNA-binding protein
MYRCYESSPFISISHFYQLLNDLYKKLSKTKLDTPYLTVEPAIQHIEDNYDKPISVKNLAKLCHVSESGFYKLFKKATSVTPIAYKHNIMIQHAIDMLSNTYASIIKGVYIYLMIICFINIIYITIIYRYRKQFT